MREQTPKRQSTAEASMRTILRRFQDYASRFSTYVNSHPFVVGLIMSVSMSVVVISLFADLVSLPELNLVLALCWYVVIIVYTVLIVLFMSGLDVIVEKTAENDQHYIGVGLFYVAFCSYIILIMAYAPLYVGRLIDSSAPNPSSLTSMYFSAMTITTVGYGDVTPKHGLARMAAATEAISGFFILLLLANTFGKMRLVKRVANSGASTSAATSSQSGGTP